jgi:hypothetical protein
MTGVKRTGRNLKRNGHAKSKVMLLAKLCISQNESQEHYQRTNLLSPNCYPHIYCSSWIILGSIKKEMHAFNVDINKFLPQSLKLQIGHWQTQLMKLWCAHNKH